MEIRGSLRAPHLMNSNSGQGISSNTRQQACATSVQAAQGMHEATFARGGARPLADHVSARGMLTWNVVPIPTMLSI